MTKLPDFPYGDSHPNADAHCWLKQRLCEGTVVCNISSLTPSRQIAVLKASIERLPWYREQFMMLYREQSEKDPQTGLQSWNEPRRLLYERGTVLYELVCHL